MSNTELTDYHWLDERTGVWTRIEMLPDRVEINLRQSYRRGMIASCVFTGFVIYVFLRNAIPLGRGLGREVALFAGFSTVAFFLKLFRQKGSIQKRFPIQIFDSSTDICHSASSQRFTADVIKVVEVRENTGRRAGDTRLCQIYIRKSNEYGAVLIYQHYFAKREHVEELADLLAQRWAARLRSSV